jgi:hypothetical protein
MSMSVSVRLRLGSQCGGEDQGIAAGTAVGSAEGDVSPCHVRAGFIAP